MRAPVAGLLAALALCLAAPAMAQTPAVEAAYREALAVTPTPASVRADQANWLSERAEAGAEDLAAVDTDRIERLNRAAARDRTVRGLRVSMDQLAQGCVPLGLDGCEAERGGWLRAPSGAILYWQVQQGSTGAEGVQGAAVLLARDGDALTPVAWTSGGFYQAPELIEAGDGGDLHVAVPGYWGGTGHYNADVLFRWTPGAATPLTEIDVRQWRATLDARLPKGLEVWKGVDFHWPALAAWTPLWTAEDGNCCASGGEANLDFDIMDGVLVLSDVNAVDRVTGLAMTLPTDVFDLVGRWAMCGHWGGEEGNDADRRAEIEAALRELRCDALDADSAVLKAKYPDRPAIHALLDRNRS